MAYIKTYSNWLPYARMKDQRGFISKQFGAGHTGVDSVGNEYNNTVCAVMDGIVTQVSYSSTLGNVVEYTAGGVRFALYHLAKTLVTVGSTVKKGDSLGIEGATGSLATGKHLHTSMWIEDVLVDPEPYLSGEKMIPASSGSMQRKVGDEVVVNGRIYSSAWGVAPTIEGGGKTYTITAIIDLPGVTKPYQLGMTGFCGESDLAEEHKDTAELEIEIERLKTALTEANDKLDEIRKVVES